MDSNYTVKIKHEGKFLTVGNIKKNQWGNYSLGMKMSPVLKKAMDDAGDSWINFSIFPDEGEKKAAKPAESQDPPPYDDDGIDF